MLCWLGCAGRAAERGANQTRRNCIQIPIPMKQRFAIILLASSFAFAQMLLVQAQEPSGVAAPLRGRKLMMKDGTFQLARSWERKGDRVRFYSIERSAWEEIPADFVDFEATKLAEAEAARAIEETTEKLKNVQQTQLAQEVDVDASIEIAPGMFLPEEDGLFILQCQPEDPQNPRPVTARCTVLSLSQIATEAKVDKKQLLKKILTPIPIIPGKQRISAAGKAAEVRLNTTTPEFYVRTADQREPEMELIRATIKGDRRELNVVSTNIAGEQRNEYKGVNVQRWQVARGVFRITLGETLAPGEYALAEFLPGEGVHLYVWDFGVDAGTAPRPAAPSKKK